MTPGETLGTLYNIHVGSNKTKQHSPQCLVRSHIHSMSQRDKFRVALGEPLPELLQKQIRAWKAEALPLCGEFIRSLRRHMITIQRLPGDLASDDERGGDLSRQPSLVLLSPC